MKKDVLNMFYIFIVSFSIQLLIFVAIFKRSSSLEKFYSLDLPLLIRENMSVIESNNHFLNEVKESIKSKSPIIVFEKNLVFGNNEIKEIKISK